MSEVCKQRFKGMENFLRKLAFNLGNTPSQTEVKIISCIPIDVSDLQKKIIQLEKQLQETKQKVYVSAAHSQSGNPCCSKYSQAENSKQQSSNSLHIITSATNPNQLADSLISFVLPDVSNQIKGRQHMDISEITPTECCTSTARRRKFSINKKKEPKKSNLKTHMVYYVRTEDKTPFNNYSLTDDESSKKRRNEGYVFNQSYLTDMVSKQYNHGAVNDGRTISEYSTPICRDSVPSQKVQEPQGYDTDMCSCCQGSFQNIDHHKKNNKVSKQNHIDIFSSYTDIRCLHTRNAYYDSNLYDVVPVKENSIKVKNFDISKRKEPKTHVDISCWPENVHLRYKPPPTITPLRQHNKRKVPLKTYTRKENVLNKMAKTRPILHDAVNPKINPKVSKASNIEPCEVYKKQPKDNSTIMISKLTPTKVTKFEDAACSNIFGINTERETTSFSKTNSQDQTETQKDTALSASLPEDKTEVTLNQIKCILQSVLTVVKNQSKLGKISEPEKKDAVVQKGPSQTNIYGGSTVLQSFTYSPNNMNPFYASSSQQTPSNFCHPNIPHGSVKGMQLYPLFVQPGRNIYDSCYGIKPQVILATMQRASAATNTDKLQVRSKETENLIKEIYKSMALNIEDPKNDTPVKEHGDINETIQNYNTSTKYIEDKHIGNGLSEIFKKTNSLYTSETLNTNTPLESASNERNFRPLLVRNCKQTTKKEKADYYNNDVNCETDDNGETEHVSNSEFDEDRNDTFVDDEIETSGSETESDEVIQDKKNEKRNLFSKMLNLFKPITRNRKRDVKKEESSDSDSVDCHTVDRHKAAAPMSTQKTTKPGIHIQKKGAKEEQSSDSDSDHSCDNLYSYKVAAPVPKRKTIISKAHLKQSIHKTKTDDEENQSSDSDSAHCRTVYSQKVATPMPTHKTIHTVYNHKVAAPMPTHKTIHTVYNHKVAAPMPTHKTIHTVYNHKVAAPMPTKTIENQAHSKSVRSKKNKDAKENQSSDSDAVHCRTVYSHKVAAPMPTHKTIKTQARSKIMEPDLKVLKKSQGKPRKQNPGNVSQRPPYMEQEYRRHFDEKLTFQDNRDTRYSSTRATATRKGTFHWRAES